MNRYEDHDNPGSDLSQRETSADSIGQERRRINRLIHDTLSQTLFSASTIAGLLTELVDSRPNQVRAYIIELDSLLKDAVTEMNAIQSTLYGVDNE